MPAARSLLLTVLGEYVLPLDATVWQETIVGALTALDYAPLTARQAVARSVRDGWLETERAGRRARLSLSSATKELLATGASRIYGFGEADGWDGRWLIVILRVPEKSRAVRHQLRSSLAWAGLGSIGGGIWLTPHAAREPEVAAMLAAEPSAGALSLKAEFGDIGDPHSIVEAAWDLDEVRRHYESFIERFSGSRAQTPEAAFRELTLMIHAWRKFPFLDPDLPASLLPRDWPRHRAHALFTDRHERWHAAATDYFLALEAMVTR